MASRSWQLVIIAVLSSLVLAQLGQAAEAGSVGENAGSNNNAQLKRQARLPAAAVSRDPTKIATTVPHAAASAASDAATMTMTTAAVVASDSAAASARILAAGQGSAKPCVYYSTQANGANKRGWTIKYTAIWKKNQCPQNCMAGVNGMLDGVYRVSCNAQKCQCTLTAAKGGGYGHVAPMHDDGSLETPTYVEEGCPLDKCYSMQEWVEPK